MGWSALRYVCRLAKASIWFAVIVCVLACKFDNTPRGSLNDPPKVTRRVLLTGLAAIPQNGCYAYTATLRTVDNQTPPVTSDTATLFFSGNGSGSFYSDADCTASVTQLDVESGELSAVFYFKDSVRESLNLTVEAQLGTKRLAGASLAMNVVTPGTPTVSDGSTYDFGVLYLTQSTDKTFTVTNTGEFIATEMVVTPAFASPFTFKGGSYPGTGGDCGTSLEPGAYCTIVLTYAPTSSGIANDAIRIYHYSGADYQTSTRSIRGQGITVASVSVSDGATYNYGSKTIGTTNDKTFTLTNSGEGTASSLAIGAPALSAPFAYKGGSYPGTGGTCSTSLNGSYVGGSTTCTIVVRYSPTAAVTSNNTIRFTYNDGLDAQTATRAIQGTGLTPGSLSLSESPSYHYGSKAVGSSTDKSFTLSNSGGSQATSLAGTALSSPFSFKDGTYPGTGATCGTTLNASASCTIIVTYAPVSHANSSGTLEVTYVDGAANQSASRTIAGSTPGQLNLNYNSTGLKTAAIGAGNDYGRAVAVQSDGKVVVAGYYMNGATREFAVARITTAGALDSTFGTSGVATTSVGTGDASAYAVAIDSSGKIVVVGSATVAGSVDFAMVRFSSTGSLDGTFGTGGKVTTAVGAGVDEAFAVAIGSGDVPIVAGRSVTAGSNDFAVVKYTSAGVLSWQSVQSIVAGHDTAYGVAVNSSDGNIYAVGDAQSGGVYDTGVLGLDSSGSLIAGFNGGSVVLVVDATRDDYANAVAIQSDGKVVLAGSVKNASANFDFFVARLGTDGLVDSGFGTSGITTTTIGSGDEEATGIGLQSDGKIVAAGYSHNGSNNDFAVLRYTTAGALDTTFNSTGKVTTAVGSAEDTGYGVSLDNTNGTIAVGGVSHNGSNLDFASALYWQ